MKKILPFILLTGLVAFLIWGRDYVSFTALAREYQTLKSLIAAHYLLAAFGFMGLYALAVALSLPIASLLTIAGGALFGWHAVGLIVIGATGGAAIVFIAAQTIMASFLSHKAESFISSLEAGFQKNAFTYLLALRLIPAAPFWVVNIVPALLGMRLIPFTLATLIGILPGTSIYVWVAIGFDEVLARGEVPNLGVLTEPKLIAPLVALGCLSLLPALWSWLKPKFKSSSSKDEQ